MSHEIPFGGRNCPVSKDVLAKSPELQKALGIHRIFNNVLADVAPAKAAKRIRQDSKPIMNKLETEFHKRLQTFEFIHSLRPQAKRFKLGNGIWFKPDFTCRNNGGREMAYEVKGEHAFRGGFENLKVAASLYPEIKWILAWKQDGQWQEQEVLA